MTYKNPQALVSTQWLEDHLSAPDVRVVDASFFMPQQERDAREEFAECHIPGAVYFDINEICADGTDLPHMVPPEVKFSSKVRKMGLGDGARIVVYDSLGVATAACRVWWMFRLFGHEDVAVLDGGLPKWLREGRPTEDGEVNPMPRHYSGRTNNFLLREVDQVAKNIGTRKEQVIDARSAGRFSGQEPEPRVCSRKGHIPGSVNVPFSELLDMKEMTFLPADAITAAFEKAGVDLGKPMTATCGSGVTACVLAFALFLLGHEDVPVYDGSWAEWAERDDLPVQMSA